MDEGDEPGPRGDPRAGIQAAADRKPPEFEGDEVEQDEGDPKGRQSAEHQAEGDEDRVDERRPAPPRRPPPPGRHHPERRPEEESEDGGEADQPESPREGLTNQGAHARREVREGDAEVAGEGVPEVVEVLAELAGLGVQAEVELHGTDRRRAHLALVTGEHRLHRVAGHEPGQGEVHRQRHPAGHHQGPKAPDHVSHRLCLSYRCPDTQGATHRGGEPLPVGLLTSVPMRTSGACLSLPSYFRYTFT